MLPGNAVAANRLGDLRSRLSEYGRHGTTSLSRRTVSAKGVAVQWRRPEPAIASFEIVNGEHTSGVEGCRAKTTPLGDGSGRLSETRLGLYSAGLGRGILVSSPGGVTPSPTRPKERDMRGRWYDPRNPDRCQRVPTLDPVPLGSVPRCTRNDHARARTIPRRTVARRRRTPLTLFRYVQYRLGRTTGEQLANALFRPFLAPTFAEFWWHWNPVFGYFLCQWTYRPLRHVVRRDVAIAATFVVCGLVHAAIAICLAALSGRPPLATLAIVWFALLGIVVALTDRYGFTLTGVAPALRPLVHLGLIVGCYRAAEWLARV